MKFASRYLNELVLQKRTLCLLFNLIFIYYYRALTIYNSDTVAEDFSDIFQDEEMQDFYAFLDANEPNVERELNEFEQYLADPLFPCSQLESFNILAWWKLNAPKYPSVSAMAQDILAIPLTSVASESVIKFKL